MILNTEKTKILGKSFFITMICFFVITSLFYLLIIGIKPDKTEILSVSEIKQTDLSKDYVLLSPQIAEWYPGELYESEDFSSQLPISVDQDANYGTYHIVLDIPSHKTYGLTGLTADYAQNIYINGELISKSGQVSDNVSDFTPKTNYFSIYFTPENDTTEIIIQLAYHNHKYGFLNEIYIAEQEVIIEKNRADFLSNGLILGILLSFVIFFIGMFLSNNNRISFLWFSLASFCATLRFSIYLGKDIMVLFPDLSWYILHKVEYISHLGFYFFLILHVISVLKLDVKRWAKWGFFGSFSVICIYYIITPSIIYTQNVFIIGTVITTVLLASIVYVLWQGQCDKKFVYRENLIVGLTTILIALSWLTEAFTYHSFSIYIQPYITMIIVFFNAIALTIQFSRSERELILLQIKEREIAKNAVMLEQINNMKTDFFHKMAHEIKTPLAIMSGYAQLTDNQIANDEVTAETSVNLKVISAEAKRLSELVSKLIEMPQLPISDAVLIELSVDEYLHYTSVVCRRILEKKGNIIVIKGKTNKYILGNLEMLVQMMINLSVNSNRHMQNGQFTIEVIEEKDGNNISFLVADTGSGIPGENAEKIFEKGYSTNGTKGLGLSICKEIAHLHNGDIIFLPDNKEKTVFKITIPIYKEEEK